MARATADTVKGVLLGDYDTVNTPSLAPFIDLANMLINRYKKYCSGISVSTDEAELTIMETWLAAHAYVCSDQTYSSKSTGGASGSFQGQTGMMLSGSKYGQMVKTMDNAGYFTLLDAGTLHNAPMFEWAGQTVQERQSWWERNNADS